MSYITIPICEPTIEKFIESIRLAAEQKPDIIELRLDSLNEIRSGDMTAEIVKEAKKHARIIVTCRDGAEGGENNHPWEKRFTVLMQAFVLGADFIDVELANYETPFFKEHIDDHLSRYPDTKLILSAHNFKEPFASLENIYTRMQAAKPNAIAKIAYRANHINDCFAGFDLLHNRKSDMIVLCMGPAGVISRIIAPKTGNFLTFASMGESKESAPGQLTIKQMRSLFRFDSINQDTKLYGILANPVGHSASPAIYNGSFNASGHNGVYLPLLLEGGKPEFDLFLNNVTSRPWLGFKGFSVTIPHKTNAFEYVRDFGTLDAKAMPLGAINTIAIDADGNTSGYNTDYAGALNPLKKAMGTLAGKKAAVIGAGGVSKAVIAALVNNGARTTIFNRTIEKAAVLGRLFNCDFASIDSSERIKTEAFDIIINCTSVGMTPNTDQSPVPAQTLTSAMTVFDTVYNPVETKLLKAAAAAAAATINGLEMFVEQAVEQYKLLTGENANRGIIEKVLREKFLINN